MSQGGFSGADRVRGNVNMRKNRLKVTFLGDKIEKEVTIGFGLEV